jgi:hypothetical protein
MEVTATVLFAAALIASPNRLKIAVKVVILA